MYRQTLKYLPIMQSDKLLFFWIHAKSISETNFASGEALSQNSVPHSNLSFRRSDPVRIVTTPQKSRLQPQISCLFLYLPSSERIRCYSKKNHVLFCI